VHELDYTGVTENKSFIAVHSEWQLSQYPTPGERNIVTNAAVIKETPEKIAVPRGTVLSFEGVVTAPPYLFAKSYFYIQTLDSIDGLLPHGIQVYMRGRDFPSLSINDVVALSGTLSLTGTEPRLTISSPDSIYQQDKQISIEPAPKFIEEIDDRSLGSLISIDGEVIERSGRTIYIADDTGELRVVLQTATDIDASVFIEGTTVTVAGVLSKTKAGLRLLPRNQADIESVVVAGAITEHIPISQSSEKDSIIKYLIATLLLLILLLSVTTYRIIKRKRLALITKENHPEGV